MLPMISAAPVLAAPSDAETLGSLRRLVGRWSGSEGLSLTAMPTADGGGVLLDVQPYTDRWDIVAMSGAAPNRGGVVNQFIGGVAYVQQSNRADGDRGVVHFENGMMLWLASALDRDGRAVSAEIATETKEGAVFARQSSVPHGNAAQLIGSVAELCGAPDIPVLSGAPAEDDAPATVSALYDVESARTGFPLRDPNALLRDALRNVEVVETTVFRMSARDGGISNVPFGERYAETTGFEATFWLETIRLPDGGTTRQLQYSQTIPIAFDIGGRRVACPHVTVATLREGAATA